MDKAAKTEKVKSLYKTIQTSDYIREISKDEIINEYEDAFSEFMHGLTAQQKE